MQNEQVQLSLFQRIDSEPNETTTKPPLRPPCPRSDPAWKAFHFRVLYSSFNVKCGIPNSHYSGKYCVLSLHTSRPNIHPCPQICSESVPFFSPSKSAECGGRWVNTIFCYQGPGESEAHMCVNRNFNLELYEMGGNGKPHSALCSPHKDQNLDPKDDYVFHFGFFSLITCTELIRDY